MNNRLDRKGFTLLEIIVAAALIAAILSMVYGSYFATSKSAKTCKARIAMFQQGRTALEQMAQQIRCGYAGKIADDANSGEPGPQQTRMIAEDSISYFTGNPNAPSGEILHLVTTNGFIEGKGPTDGLFEITYKFDKSTSALSLSQEEFVGTAKKVEKRNWRPIANNVTHLELAFFDGQEWLRSWDSKDKKKLPYAVRIEISCEDKDYRRRHYSTVAHVSCRKNRARTQTEMLLSVNKQ